MANIALTKYLTHYCEPEVTALTGLQHRFNQGLVIPVYRESVDMRERFIQWAIRAGNVLLVLVINRPDTDTDVDWAAPFLEPGLPLDWQSTNNTLRCYGLENRSGLLVVDRCKNGPPIPKKQGVGLARKIGADILCQLIANQQIRSPWIANTDADAILPEDYFSTVPSNETFSTDKDDNIAALIYPYRHISQDNGDDILATRLYEFSLHYYVAGLQWAGSPYAYQTLGSTIAVHYQHYARVRGFPKRSAAEDFYLLNKLAKTGKVVSLKGPVIKLLARESERVPFGTGPAVKALTERDNPFDLPLYHPQTFTYLKAFLSWAKALCQEDHFDGDLALAIPSPILSSDLDDSLLLAVSEKMGLASALAHCFEQGQSAEKRLQHFHTWFDAFRTLKFIHTIRDKRLDSITYRDWRKHYYPDVDRYAELAEWVSDFDQHDLA